MTEDELRQLEQLTARLLHSLTALRAPMARVADVVGIDKAISWSRTNRKEGK